MNKEPQLALPFTAPILARLALGEEGQPDSTCCLQSPEEPRRSQVQPAAGAGPRKAQPTESSQRGWATGSPQHREATGSSADVRNQGPWPSSAFF